MNAEPVTQVGVIGAGELGQALGHVLEKTGLQVLYYDREDSRTTTASIADVAMSCSVLLLCVPARATREVAKGIAKHSNPHNPPLVISLSKGVEKGFVTMDRVLHDTLPSGTPYGLLYGPMLARELVAHQMGAGVLALSEADYAPMVRELFGKARVYLEVENDMHAVAVSGVLKNIYALAFGMNDGLKLGANARGRVGVQALREMKRVLRSLEVDADAAQGLAGLGDLLATGTSESSFNYRIGRGIAEQIADVNVQSEGLSALQELSHAVRLSDYPLAEVLDKIVYHYGHPEEFTKLLEN